MSNFEKKIGENMVDDMLPPEPTAAPRPSRGTYLDRMDAEMGRGVDHTKYDDDFWKRGGDDMSDMSDNGASWEKVTAKKPFNPRPSTIPDGMNKHPKVFLREDYEGPGGYARAKLATLSKDHPFVFMGATGTIDTYLLESIVKVLMDEMSDLLEETELVWKEDTTKKIRAFLRQTLLDGCVGWDTMVKKYKPINEKP